MSRTCNRETQFCISVAPDVVSFLLYQTRNRVLCYSIGFQKYLTMVAEAVQRVSYFPIQLF